jgi:hypothetical protein
VKAIIISDAEARALLDKLTLKSMHKEGHFRQYSEPVDFEKPASISAVHRAFNYVVVRWLQEMGADTVGR